MKFVLSGLSRFSLSVRLLVISLGMFLALILVSSVSVISSVNKNLSSIGTAKAEAFVQFLRTSSGSYITNYDITALSEFQAKDAIQYAVEGYMFLISSDSVLCKGRIEGKSKGKSKG